MVRGFEPVTSRRILVTGGAGFVGTHLVRRLVEDGHAVVVLDAMIPQVHTIHQDRELDVSASLGCEVRHADVRDADAVGRAMAGVEIVHHLAAETGVGQSQYEISRYVATNTLGTAVVLEAAVAAGVQQVIVASSRAVYGEGRWHCPRCGLSFTAHPRRPVDMSEGVWDVLCPSCAGAGEPVPMAEDHEGVPTSIYGITKLQQEQLSRMVGRIHGLPVTLLRLFNVFGPGQSLQNPYVGVLGAFFRQASSGGVAELYEDGHMRRDFVFIGDVVEAFRATTANSATFGLTLNVGSGSAAPLADVAEGIFECLSMEPRLAVSGRYRVGDIRHAVSDVGLMEEILGFRPRTPLAEGLAAYVAWARSNPADAPDDAAQAQLVNRRLLRQGRV